jgi:Holliday junction resolvase
VNWGYNLMKSEKDVKKKVKAIFDKHGWFWWMIPANGYGASGISDFHALKDHVFMVVETKFGSNKPTALQKGFMTSIASEGCGGYAFVVTDKNWEFFDQFLESFAIAASYQSRMEEVPAEHGSRMLNAIAVLTKY